MNGRERRGQEWAGKQVLVVGLGASGFATARVLARLDAKVQVTEDATSAGIEERAGQLLLRDRGRPGPDTTRLWKPTSR